MNRRTLIGALGSTIALAGCVSDDTSERHPETGSDDEQRDDDPDQTRSERETGPVLEQFDGAPERPECSRDSETIEVEDDDETRTYETAETIPYPDPPETFTEDEVVDFVDAFENAYVTHGILCGREGSAHILDIHYDVRTSETFEWDADLTTVFLLRAGAVSSMLHDDGSVSVADIGYSGVVYAVDESGVARVDFDDANAYGSDELESRAPDPLAEGTLVAAFD